MEASEASLAERLSAIRHGLFVGRVDEQAFFRSALEATELPCCVLHVYGPGGVGKTALLHEFAALCASMSVQALRLDAHNIEPSPEAFTGALALAMRLTPPASPLQAIAREAHRHVILVDTYELLAPLDHWLRDSFLPQLPQNTLMVLAGRHSPAPAWRADAGWQKLVRSFPLRNLNHEESRDYLARRDVPHEQHQAILGFTHGHPLALSLVADLFSQHRGAQGGQSGSVRFNPEEAPDIVQALLEHLVQNVPSAAHRAALEVCALVRLTTEALLADVLSPSYAAPPAIPRPGSPATPEMPRPKAARSKAPAAQAENATPAAQPDAHELFEWLRRLSFIESGRLGIFPHDLTREALLVDLRWRNPSWHTELHRRARAHYSARLQQTSGQEQQGVLFDYIFLHRSNPVVRPFFEWQEGGNLTVGAARESEMPALVEMVARHEGDASARLAAHWFARQPQGVLVLREATGEAAGFVAQLALHRASAEDLNADPATRAAWRHLERHAPLRPGEGATLFRFWMARDTYQAVSPAQSLIFVNVARHYLTTPRLAYSFFPCAEPDFWAPAFAYADTVRLPDADFKVGRRCYGMYGHDWRVVPPTAWLDLLAERETAQETQAPAPPTSALLVVLSEAEFAAAVRAALRHLHQPAALRENVLLRSRLVAQRAGGATGVTAGSAAGDAERVAALQALLRETCEALRTSARESRFYRALYHTYLEPAPTQERAAELMDIPFSTFRRHLQAGVAQVTKTLWQREVEG